MAKLDDFVKVANLAALVFGLIQSQRDLMKRRPSKATMKHLQDSHEAIGEMISLLHKEELIPKDDADWLAKEHSQVKRQIRLTAAQRVNAPTKGELMGHPASRASQSSSPPKGS